MSEVNNEVNGMSNAQILEKIRELTAQKKAKRTAVVEAVDKLWADYVAWRESEYKKTREGLLKMLSDNHLARVTKREEKAAAADAVKQEAPAEPEA